MATQALPRLIAEALAMLFRDIDAGAAVAVERFRADSLRRIAVRDVAGEMSRAPVG